MSGEQILFWLFALMACAGAIGVVVSQIIVRMAVSLILCLASVSALFFLHNADFVGAVQLMVYVGGTIILLIFGIMLTSSSPFSRITTSPAEGFLAAGIGALFLAIIAFTVVQVDWDVQADRVAAAAPVKVSDAGYNDAADGNTSRPLALAFLGLRPDQNGLAPGYLLPFEIVSVHLLVVLVGAAYLARTKRRAAVDA
ncbi:MAG: NADH-quinone oxidoreductase subunit J family protein [Planctomycetota bacterium]|jgi:NADH:ubiquinone oxidoreductase subunit 6 (subunit J)